MGLFSVRVLPGSPRLRKESGLVQHFASPVGGVLDTQEEELENCVPSGSFQMPVSRKELKLASLGYFLHCQFASYYTGTVKEKLKTNPNTMPEKCIKKYIYIYV